MKLVDLEITNEQFATLPMLADFTETDLKENVPLGFRCRDDEGNVRELVKGTEMFAHQWGSGMSLPARGWRYYRPIIKTPSDLDRAMAVMAKMATVLVNVKEAYEFSDKIHEDCYNHEIAVVTAALIDYEDFKKEVGVKA